mgnify:FL=1
MISIVTITKTDLSIADELTTTTGRTRSSIFTIIGQSHRSCFYLTNQILTGAGNPYSALKTALPASRLQLFKSWLTVTHVYIEMSNILLQTFSRSARLASNLNEAIRSHSSASNLLIQNPKYAFLKELGLGESNLGAFNGGWFATGEVMSRLNTCQSAT